MRVQILIIVQPLQVREEVKSRSSKVKALHVWCSDKKRLQYVMQTGLALEQGRLVNFVCSLLRG
jgi:hypothetical protein